VAPEREVTPVPAGRKLVFIGFMGAGKSTAARAAGGALGVEVVDLDAVLEERLGKPIAQVFAQDGEATFRAAEEAAALELLGAPGGGVVALGGGTPVSERVRQALADHSVVWLDVDLQTAWARAVGEQRPLATDEAAFARLYAAREPVYGVLADVILSAPREADMRQLVEALRELPSGARMLWATSAGGEYPVYLGRGLLEQRFWPADLEGRRFLVTDGRVGALYGDSLEPLAGRVSIMPGEQSKTVAHADIVWTELARSGATRGDLVVALGGGVVGDLAGFCAATYQRGVRWIGVPTTLVAQVDSAYGGKTGVDLPEAKNYVGAYHQPSAVVVDPDTLASLPEAELAAGYAEVVKTALIAGGGLWQRVSSGADAADLDIIVDCARIKLRIVAADERDAGVRQVLNLGHTVGHAIEAVTGYARYRHGEAVGLGLLAALRLSGQDRLREQVRDLLAERGLPVALEGVDSDAVVMATARDKKRVGVDAVPFVLLESPGRARAGQRVPERALVSAVRELAAQ
jgi:shikimate kinase/3-dehydroquinate synthase